MLHTPDRAEFDGGLEDVLGRAVSHIDLFVSAAMKLVGKVLMDDVNIGSPREFCDGQEWAVDAGIMAAGNLCDSHLLRHAAHSRPVKFRPVRYVQLYPPMDAIFDADTLAMSAVETAAL